MTEVAARVVDEMNHLIDKLGDTITIYAVTSTAYSARYHDATPTYAVGVSAKGLIVSKSNDLVKQAEGELLRNRTLFMRVKASISIANKYKVSRNSVDYEVTFEDMKRTEDTDLYHIVELTKMDSV
jgi:hypothetical protein